MPACIWGWLHCAPPKDLWEVAMMFVSIYPKLHALSLNSWWIKSSSKLDINKIFFSLCEALIWFGLALFWGYLLRKKKVFRDPPSCRKIESQLLRRHALPLWSGPSLFVLLHTPSAPCTPHYSHGQSCEAIYSVPRLFLLPKCLLPPLSNYTWLDSLLLDDLLQEASLEHAPSPDGSGCPDLLLRNWSH